MNRVLFFVLLTISSAASGAITYGPVQWSIADGGNGHYYQLVDYQTGISWTSAKSDAETMTLFGSIGHLVTVTSAPEDAFLKSNFQAYIGDPPSVPGIFAWIGLSDAASEGNFVWVTGEPLTYTNWAPPEPNGGTSENYVHLWVRKFTGSDLDPVNGTPLWSWNDVFNDRGPEWRGAFIEFDGPFTSNAAVPEPSTLIIWAMGMIAVANGRKRRK
ncbi:MAG TPA: C-type lectin domain-containing protein [Pirellula sp.]|nr:C-type lectin domain-containing protein [Pirellula sp.]